jgi:hypothetical protein
VHPLDTLLEAAIRLKGDPRFCFVFVGGGSEFGRLRRAVQVQGLANVKFLPYQPIESLSGSLSAADLQAVVLGNAMVGTIHPSKLYNILAVGSPVLYVGPERSHVSDAMEQNQCSGNYIRVDFGDAASLTAWLVADCANWNEEGRTIVSPGARNYSQEVLLPQLVQIIEGSG